MCSIHEFHGVKIVRLMLVTMFLVLGGIDILSKAHAQECGQPGSAITKVDIVFCLDISGSMGDEIQQVKDNIGLFVDELKASGLDPRLGLITFGAGAFPYLEVRNNGEFYESVDDFVSEVATLQASGWREEWFEAVGLATEYDFRPDAAKVIILITDENGDPTTDYPDVDHAIAKVQGVSARVYAISYPYLTNVVRLVDETNDSPVRLKSIEDPFSDILSDFAADIQGAVCRFPFYITGHVYTPAGSPVEGATVMLLDEGLNEVASTMTYSLGGAANDTSSGNEDLAGIYYLEGYLEGAGAASFFVVAFSPDRQITAWYAGNVSAFSPENATMVEMTGDVNVLEGVDIYLGHAVTWPTYDRYHNFGSVAIGQTASWTMWLKNTTGVQLNVNGVRLASGSQGFSVVGDDCSLESLSANETCSVQIEFTPPAAGSFTDVLYMETEPDFGINVTLQGTGTVSTSGGGGGTVTAPEEPSQEQVAQPLPEGEDEEEVAAPTQEEVAQALEETSGQVEAVLEALEDVQDEQGEAPESVTQEVVDQAAAVVESVSETVLSAVDALESGADVAVEDALSLAQNLDELVEVVTTEVVPQEGAEGQAAIDLEKAEEILDTVTDVAEAMTVMAENVESLDDAVAVVETVDDVVSAGIVSAVVTGDEGAVEKIVSIVGDVVITALEKAMATAGDEQAPSPESLIDVLDASGETIVAIVEKINEVASMDTTDQEVVEAVKAQVVEEVKASVKGVVDAMDALEKDIVTTDHVERLSDGVSAMVGGALKVSEQGLSGEMVETVHDVLDNMVELVVDDVMVEAAPELAGEVETQEELEEALGQRPELAERLIEVASLDVTEALVLDEAVIEETVVQTLGSEALDDPALVKIVKQAIPSVPDPERPVLSMGDEAVTPLAVVNGVLGAMGLQTSVDEVLPTGAVTMSVATGTDEAPLRVSLVTKDVRLVPQAVPDGLDVLPNGRVRVVKDGVATTFTPFAPEPVELAATVTRLFNKDPGEGTGFSFKLDEEGMAILTTEDGQTYALGFSYLMETHRSGGGGVTFTVQGTDPASEAYTVLARYGDGTVQAMPPMVLAFDGLLKALDAAVPRAYSIDRNTGVITIEGIGRFKPDYAVDKLSLREAAWFWSDASGRDESGNAWKVEDVNGDGITDVIHYTESGKQVIYGLKQ